MPPRAIIPGLLGKGPVVLLAFVRDGANFFRVAFVSKLGTEQALLGRCVPNVMFDAKSADPLALLWHVDDKAIVDSARSTGLVVNAVSNQNCCRRPAHAYNVYGLDVGGAISTYSGVRPSHARAPVRCLITCSY